MFTEDKFTLAFQVENVKVFLPNNTMEFHASRFLEATRQNMYASAGATDELIKQHLDAIIELCNQTGELKTIRTDIAGIANALKMRMKYPIDQYIAVRMGIVLSFAEINEKGNILTEDPNKCEAFWLDKKMQLALQYPDLFAFFFSVGASSTAAYNNLLDILNDTDYFDKRRMKILAVLPENFAHLAN